MRIQLVEPQRTVECGICKSGGEWLKRVNVESASGLYCFKCDTLTIFEPFHDINIRDNFKYEIEQLKK